MLPRNSVKRKFIMAKNQANGSMFCQATGLPQSVADCASVPLAYGRENVIQRYKEEETSWVSWESTVSCRHNKGPGLIPGEVQHFGVKFYVLIGFFSFFLSWRGWQQTKILNNNQLKKIILECTSYVSFH